MPAGRRQTMFTVACDLAARGWTVDDATTAIMERMQTVGLPADELADCPRQIANAWRTPRTPLGAAPTAARPQSDPPETYRPFPADALPFSTNRRIQAVWRTASPTHRSMFW